jgi:hypothetical protein
MCEEDARAQAGEALLGAPSGCAQHETIAWAWDNAVQYSFSLLTCQRVGFVTRDRSISAGVEHTIRTRTHVNPMRWSCRLRWWCVCWAVIVGAAQPGDSSQWVPHWHPRARRNSRPPSALRGPGLVDSAVLLHSHVAPGKPFLPQVPWNSTGRTGRIYLWLLLPSRDNPAASQTDAARAGGALYDGQWRAVASAALHTLALDDDGMVWSWGSQEEHSDTADGVRYGRHVHADGTRAELGRPAWSTNLTATQAGFFATPRRVSGLPERTVIGVAAGRYHSLAVDNAGVVYSWGMDVWGQLGAPPPPRDVLVGARAAERRHPTDREGGIADPADTSRSNLAAALGLRLRRRLSKP